MLGGSRRLLAGGGGAVRFGTTMPDLSAPAAAHVTGTDGSTGGRKPASSPPAAPVATTVAERFEAARAGDRRALARLLSWVEAGGDRGRQVAAVAYRSSEEAATVGITGAPGAGKSTLTGRLVAVARDATASKVAVVAIDPTSPFTGGAVLGDRIRMQDHSDDDGVFIRSMATRGHLGGLAVAVPEAVRVLGATGWPLVVVETVGVGQVEVEVASATDTVVVVVNPRWGDAVQANKAGLLEVADIFVVNKADQPGAAETRRDLEQMLDLAGHQRGEGQWRPPVLLTVASAAGAGAATGVAELWEAVRAHQQHLAATGELERRRQARLERELDRVVDARLAELVAGLGGDRQAVVSAVLAHELDPYEAADRLVAGLGGRR